MLDQNMLQHQNVQLHENYNKMGGKPAIIESRCNSEMTNNESLIEELLD